MLTHPPSLHTHLKPEPHWVQTAFRPSLGAPHSAPLLWPAGGNTTAHGSFQPGTLGDAANRRGRGLAGGRSPGLAAGSHPVFLLVLSLVTALARSTMPLLAAPPHLQAGVSVGGVWGGGAGLPRAGSCGSGRKWCWVTKGHCLGVRRALGKQAKAGQDPRGGAWLGGSLPEPGGEAWRLPAEPGEPLWASALQTPPAPVAPGPSGL